MLFNFRYKKAYKIAYKSCMLHSLLELKFVLSIEDRYKFLREHIPIYYDPRTNIPTNYLRENTRRYTADFLIPQYK